MVGGRGIRDVLPRTSAFSSGTLRDRIIKVERGTLVRDRYGDLFQVLFIEADGIVMRKLDSAPDAFHTRIVNMEDFNRHGYAIVEKR